MLPQKFPRSYPLPKIVLLLFLLVCASIGAVPGYLTGKWRWAHPPEVKELDRLRQLRKTGVAIAGWKTLSQETVLIGNHEWLKQEIEILVPVGSPGSRLQKAILLLLAQNDHADQPEVEWTDINGWQQWQTDSDRWAKFAVASPQGAGVAPAEVEARFFRGWTNQQTYAVLQWYAVPTGGHPAPSRWFWADRLAQLSDRRLPWVAVSVLIPVEPLGDIEKSRQLAESLGQSVQAAVMAGIQ